MNPLFEAAGLVVFERGWLSSNNVLFRGDDSNGSTLVDSGYCTHAEQTLALVRRALGAGRPLDHLINTHLHSDHCGGNHALRSAFGCTIAVPSGEAHKVDTWDENALTYRATGQKCPRFARTESICGGDEVRCGSRRWQAFAAPGHDPESLVLYEPEFQLLISADALWENGFGVVFPELEGSAAFAEVGATLDLIDRLPIRWVIPGHGSPFCDVRGAIDRARRRLDTFLADPRRHALYAAKVLVKFHLLELQELATSELMTWLDATHYMHLAHEEHFDEVEFSVWCRRILADMVDSGAICMTGANVRNA